MEYDIIFATGEIFFDHPLCGVAILKRLLEKKGYSVGIIECPQKEEDIRILGKPKLFFGISSGSIDSMMRNYTPLKKKRDEDKNLEYAESIPDRAVTVYCNWIRKNFKDSIMVLGGTEASLRRFVHYDYWDNKLRKPILFDSRADIIAYGSAEKQILEIAERTKEGTSLEGIKGTCIISKEVPEGFEQMPSFDEVSKSNEKFCEMQMMLSNRKNLSQKIDNRFALQYKSPEYTSKDLDEYYGLPFSRRIPAQHKHLRSFEFSVVTHRGCIGKCNFCSISLLQGDRVISRSEKSILDEIKSIAKMEGFRGNIDDLGGPSANMYGMDCGKCAEGICLECPKLDKSCEKAVSLLKKARQIPGVKNVFIRSGIRYDLASKEYIQEVALHHVFGTLRIAPEHVSSSVLSMMNKNRGDLKKFIEEFMKSGSGKEISFYFMVGHPGCGIKECEELAEFVKHLKNAEAVQVFTPSPMSVSTCMYYTGINPKTGKKVYVPYSYSEKKQQKRIVMDALNSKK